MERRSFLKGSVGLPIAVAGAGSAMAGSKLPKAGVMYQEKPKGDERCDNCKFWVEGGGCTKVKGDIAPEAWCDIWQPA